jgi:hypothetical protein
VERNEMSMLYRLQKKQTNKQTKKQKNKKTKKQKQKKRKRKGAYYL